MFILSALSMILCLLLIILNSILGKKTINEREKPSPFECGFDPKSSARLPFSLRFYLIALIFLIFDVEITLILPIPLMSIQPSNFLMISITTTYFILILILGLFHEWKEGALQWDI